MERYSNIQEIFETAERIQDASNWRGVCREFGLMQAWFQANYRDCKDEDRLAVTKMMVYKMAQLAFEHEPIIPYGDAFSDACTHVKHRIQANKLPTTPDELYKRFPRIHFAELVQSAVLRALEFGKGRNIAHHLMDKLDYLNEYAGERSNGCDLYSDGAPHSFGFTMRDAQGKFWFNGGLIYHGQGDTGVGAPTFSVRVGDTEETWSIHT